jgi:hypothetical protein
MTTNYCAKMGIQHDSRGLHLPFHPDNLSPFAYRMAEKFGGEILKVGFEFQKNAGYMLKIKL